MQWLQSLSKLDPFDHGLLSNLVNSVMGINGFGRLFSQPLGYFIISVQVEGVRGSNEIQVALVVPDSSAFGSWVLVTLGTLTINCIISMIKESEIYELSASLNGSRVSHMLECHWAQLSIRSEMAMNQITGPANLNRVVKTINKEEIEAFLSKIIHAQTKTMFLSSNMHTMKQSLEGDDEACLPHGLSVMNTYTKVTTRSRQVAVVVKNPTTAPITIANGIKVTQVVSTNVVPQVVVVPGILEKLDEIQGIQQTRMSVEQRKETFLQWLELSGLEGWSDKNQAAARVLLAEYHDIFVFKPGELGCTDLAKHDIRVINDEPFNERFLIIAPLMVDEVHAHVEEMLEAGAIYPSQSLWCNAIALVHKKDVGLQFCINFHK